jgi:hypothetical protein
MGQSRATRLSSSDSTSRATDWPAPQSFLVPAYTSSLCARRGHSRRKGRISRLPPPPCRRLVRRLRRRRCGRGPRARQGSLRDTDRVATGAPRGAVRFRRPALSLRDTDRVATGAMKLAARSKREARRQRRCRPRDRQLIRAPASCPSLNQPAGVSPDHAKCRHHRATRPMLIAPVRRRQANDGHLPARSMCGVGWAYAPGLLDATNDDARRRRIVRPLR